ncbi:VCBS repeat-containing protein [Streptomyces sp. WAC 06738]|uniref:FG-GAP repeat domain-containing protein n=1 Tax=Streptomyces sp. WAC 06738 TaxID=2203210 RepID=UPI000F6D5941|nr:VCBS repeat-containing protein [Streptomyces sp. WAC 06738]AZM49400.1 VCBS repeat-containing protein [Streptomyces sp. WAC 06738]
MYVRSGGAIAASGRILAAVVLPAALLAAGCGGGDGEEDEAAACTFASERDGGASGRAGGPAHRDDVDGDGHADVVANGWYKVPAKPGAEWRNNRFVLRAAAGGPDPSAAFPLTGCYPPHGPQSQYPVGHDFSVQLTGDLDDDGYADVLVRGVRGPDGSQSRRQRILWGGPDGPVAATDLPRDADPAAAVGDFDGDGTLDLLTLAVSGGEYDMRAQPATVLRGPLDRAGGKPRGETGTDVGFGGWASVTDVAVGDFDGDGRDDLVTKATYDEEDVRFEEDMPEEVVDAALYRGTPEGLRLAGAVPGVTSGSRDGATPLVAGDFDGDGTDDLVARGWLGDAVVVYGSPEGPGGGRRAVELGRRVGLAGVAGDVNGDGTDDLATSYSPSGGEGEVAVVLGGPGGLAVAGTQVVVPQDVGAEPGLRRNADHLFGWQLHLADLDTDGDDDLVVGTFRAGDPPGKSGYWIFQGTPEGTSVADREFVTTEDAG